MGKAAEGYNDFYFADDAYKNVKAVQDALSVLDVKSKVIKSGLSLEEAQAHCRDKETSSGTCTLPKNKKHTEKYGMWFDGYEIDGYLVRSPFVTLTDEAKQEMLDS